MIQTADEKPPDGLWDHLMLVDLCHLYPSLTYRAGVYDSLVAILSV